MTIDDDAGEGTDVPTESDAAGTTTDTIAPAPVRPSLPRWRLPKLPLWQEIPLLLAVGVLLAIVLKSFVVQSFHIPTASMQPGLEKGDAILVQKVSYWFGDTPERGDVVVFRDPGGWLGNTGSDDDGAVKGLLTSIGLYPEGGHLVKRVIGVPGDVIVCCDKQGRIVVNGKALDESDYVAEPSESEEFPCNGPMTGNCKWRAGPVPKDALFVMGDDRDASDDSSYHLCAANETECTDNPYVDVDLVVGKAFMVVWPGGNIGPIRRPAAFDDIPDPE